MAPKKLMVTIKLELKDAVQLRWLDDSRPGKPWKARLRSVTLPDGTKLDVDSTNVSETIVPTKGQDRTYDVFFMGYWELAADDPDQRNAAGKKNVPVAFELELVDPTTNVVAEVGKVYEIVRAPATASFSAMG